VEVDRSTESVWPGRAEDPPFARGNAAWVAVALAGALLALACLFALALPPRGLVPVWVAVPVWVGFAAWIRFGRRRPSVHDCAVRWVGTILASFAVGTAVLDDIWSPAWLGVLIWLASDVLGIAALITGLARVRRRPAELAVVFGLCVLLFVVDVPWRQPLAELGIEARLHLVAQQYEDQAKELFASPPARSNRPTDPEVGRTDSGRPVLVAWIWNQGLAVGSSGGVAYDPDGHLDHGRIAGDLTFNYWVPYDCDHLFDDFYACTFT
jgi:hypothetical protein